MTLLLATLIGLLFAVGTFLVLRRDVVAVVWGMAVYGQGANLVLLAMGGIVEPDAQSVPVWAHHGGPPPETTDPVVQALVLTAIVIGFGMTAFAMVVTYRMYEEHGTLDLHDLGGEG